MGVIFLE